MSELLMEQFFALQQSALALLLFLYLFDRLAQQGHDCYTPFTS